MSFIIKGINLPEEDKSLKLEIFDGGETVWIDRGSEWEVLESGAVQIPEGHGRLIDGDKLTMEFIDWQYTEAPDELNATEERTVSDLQRQYEIYTTVGEAIKGICDAHTVLEAERQND